MGIRETFARDGQAVYCVPGGGFTRKMTRGSFLATTAAAANGASFSLAVRSVKGESESSAGGGFVGCVLALPFTAGGLAAADRGGRSRSTRVGVATWLVVESGPGGLTSILWKRAVARSSHGSGFPWLVLRPFLVTAFSICDACESSPRRFSSSTP